jgi:DNA-directed RNA polymerase specialized sigma24 family protein
MKNSTLAEYKVMFMNKADILKEILPKEALILIKSVGLKRKYEKILIMRYVYDMSCTEIADALNVEVQTARNKVCKARKMFDKFTENL